MQPTAFSDLLRRHGGLIAKVAYAYCRDATDRDDVVQEIAVQLWRCLDGMAALDKALVLLWLDGNDHATTADVLGISVSNVGTKLARIKERLTQLLATEPDPKDCDASR